MPFINIKIFEFFITLEAYELFFFVSSTPGTFVRASSILFYPYAFYKVLYVLQGRKGTQTCLLHLALRYIDTTNPLLQA